MKKENIEKLKISLAQIKLVSGDLKCNSEKIINCINKAIIEKTDILVFPELSITAYNCGILFNQFHFLEYQIDFLSKSIIPIVPENLIVILGYVRIIGTQFDGNPQIANSAMVIQNGKILGTYDKILLANYGHHEDKKYFYPGNIPSPINAIIRGEKLNIGLVICEDIFSDDHRRNIPNEIIKNGAEILISINQSFFHYGKQNIRKKVCKSHAIQNNIYVIYVNNVGIGDISKNFILYDGGSMIVAPDGRIVCQCKRFEEDFKSIILNKEQNGEIYHPEKFQEIFDALVYAQREIFKDLGFEKAIVCVSGGLDSSVTLPIVVEAMGAENVYALTMPSKYNGDTTKSNALQLCGALNVKLFWEPIENIQHSFINSFKETFNKEPELINISTFDAVGRTVAGIAASQSLKAGLVSTSNHTELVLNWFSWHDISTAAVYAPLGDMSKVEIFEMAKYINKRYNRKIIPENLYNGLTEPGPELADASTAKWNYFIMSGICCYLIRKKKGIFEIIQEYKNHTLSDDYFPLDPKGKNIYDLCPTVEEFEKWVKLAFNRQKQSVYKNAQSAPPLMISPLSRGFSNRETIINKYQGIYNDSDFEFSKNELETA